MIFSLWRTFNILGKTKGWPFHLALADITEAKQRKKYLWSFRIHLHCSLVWVLARQAQ